jgi:signal transduction histidine kinase/putative methionine-R-sulfoxide reductase with GAF domain
MHTTSTIDKLYAALEKHQRQLEALRSVSLRVTRSLDLECVMQQAADAVCNVLGVEAAAVSIVDPEREELVIRAQRGMKAFAHEPVHLPKGIGLAWETLLNRETIIIESWENEPRLAVPSFLDENIRSTILVPMLINGEPVGVLSAMTRTSHTFTPDEQNMIAGIADQVAAALLNARLHHQTRQQSQERAFLFNLATAVAPLHEIKQVAQTALEHTLQYLDWSSGVLLTVEESNVELIPLAETGCASAVQHLIAETRALTRRPESEHRLTFDANGDGKGARLHIPLQARQHTLAWLALSTRKESSTEKVCLPEHLRETLIAEGVYLGIALENIQLYRKMIERERANSVLYQMAHAMTGQDLPQMLQQMLRELIKGIPYEAAEILLTEQPLQVLHTHHSLSPEQLAEIESHLYAFLDVPEHVAKNRIVIQDSQEPIKALHPLAYLETPIVQGETTTGGIILARQEPFTAHEQRLLFITAYQLGKAIMATKLFHQAQEQADQLEEITRLLREREMQRTHIFDDLAQEMRDPVTFIQSYPELLLDGGLGPLNEGQNEALTSLQEHAQFLARLVRDLGAMRVANPEKLHTQETDIADLLHDAITIAQPGAKRKNIALTIDIEADLPNVWLDPQQMLRGIEKLLNNAIRFTLPNGTVHLSAQRQGATMIRVAITDAGPEIPQHERELFFRRLYHGNLERTYPGAGIELALAQQIVESHGGVIGVESAKEGGNTFYFTLPIQKKRDA